MIVAVAALLLLGFLLPQGASAAVKCQYDATTRLLSVTASGEEEEATIRRVGMDITVSGLFESRVHCGGSPTVVNTDHINVTVKGFFCFVTISLAGGRFVPGASPEPDSSAEIEFTASTVDSGTVRLHGGPGADHFRYLTAEAQSGINLNPGPGDEDIDLLVPDPETELEVSGEKGSDTIEGVGHSDLDLVVFGGPGSDTLVASENGATLNGGAGRDRLIGGAGFDLLLPGSGMDLVRAGSGSDTIWMRPDNRRDRIDCGRGHDKVERFAPAHPHGSPIDPFDHLRSCERVREG